MNPDAVGSGDETGVFSLPGGARVRGRRLTDEAGPPQVTMPSGRHPRTVLASAKTRLRLRSVRHPRTVLASAKTRRRLRSVRHPRTVLASAKTRLRSIERAGGRLDGGTEVAAGHQ